VLAEYARDKSDVVGIIGPLGSGKTIQTCQKAFDIMCDQEPDENGVRRSRAYAIRNTYGDLLNTTVKDWLDLYRDLGRYTAGGMKPPEHHLNFELEDGTTVDAEMVFIALDRPDSVKKLRGAQLTFVWFNEIKELSKAVFDMAIARCGRYPAEPTWYGAIGDTNAPDVDHWLYKIAELDTPSDWKFYKQPGGVVRNGTLPNGKVNWAVNREAENINNLPPDYYKKNARGKSDDWIAVNLGNEYGFVSDGKPVFPEYRDDFHNHEVEFIEELPIYRGWDFGTPACVLAQYTRHGQLVVFKEFTSKQTTGIDVFSDHVVNECAELVARGHEFIDVGDPAGEQRSQQKDAVTCFSILHEKGIDIQAGKQDLTARLEGVRHFLSRLVDGLPAFVLNGAKCPMLRKGFQGAYCYRRIQTHGERYTEKPDKGPASHPHDALQYICTFIRAGYSDFLDDDDYDDYEDPNDGRDISTGY
jgi:hypothetical protein